MAPKLKQSEGSQGSVAMVMLVVFTATKMMIMSVEADVVSIVNDMGPGVMLEVECSTNEEKSTWATRPSTRD